MKDVHSYTPLLTAAEYGQVEGFKLLLEKEAMLVDKSKNPPVVVKSKDRKTALFLAAEHNHSKIIEVQKFVKLCIQLIFQLCAFALRVAHTQQGK